MKTLEDGGKGGGANEVHYGKYRSGLKAISQLPKHLFQSEVKCRAIDLFLLVQITLVFALSFVFKVSFLKLGNGILRPLGFKKFEQETKNKRASSICCKMTSPLNDLFPQKGCFRLHVFQNKNKQTFVTNLFNCKFLDH